MVIVFKINDLGREFIPKEIRRTMRIHEGDGRIRHRPFYIQYEIKNNRKICS